MQTNFREYLKNFERTEKYQIAQHPRPIMPKQVTEIKEFLHIARRKDAKQVTLKKNKNVTKFKIRCSKYLYTLCVSDRQKVDKLRQSLPPALTVKEL